MSVQCDCERALCGVLATELSHARGGMQSLMTIVYSCCAVVVGGEACACLSPAPVLTPHLPVLSKPIPR